MRELTTNVYTFDELSDEAKEKARGWYRKASEGDNYFYENVVEDAKQAFENVGIRIDRVFYSGFCSQGDGACFEGAWYARDFKPGKLEEYAPKDEELHRIAKEFQEIVEQYPNAAFLVKHSGHYYHRFCTSFDFDIDTEDSEKEYPESIKMEEQVTELARDCMEWIYEQLEKGYEFSNSDEQVDETIRSNEYEFTQSGSRRIVI